MSQQQQHVSDLAGLAQINQLPLQPKPFAIINLTELDDRNHVAIEIIGPQRSAGILPAVLNLGASQGPHEAGQLHPCGNTAFSFSASAARPMPLGPDTEECPPPLHSAHSQPY